MKRVMVNFDDEMGRQVEARAKAEKRSMSAHIVRLVERDLEAAGMLPQSAELYAAVAEVGGPDKAVEILQTSVTPTRPKSKRPQRQLRKTVRQLKEAA